MESFGLFLLAESIRISSQRQGSEELERLYQRASKSFNELAQDFGSYVYRDMDLQCQALEWRSKLTNDRFSAADVLSEAHSRMSCPQSGFEDCEARAYWAIGALHVVSADPANLHGTDLQLLQLLVDSALRIARYHDNWELRRDIVELMIDRHDSLPTLSNLTLQECVSLVARFPSTCKGALRLCTTNECVS